LQDTNQRDPKVGGELVDWALNSSSVVSHTL